MSCCTSVELARLIGCARPVAPEQLGAERRHVSVIAVDHDVALEHHAAQLGILQPGLHLKGRARVALEVSHLLGLGEGPGPQVFVAHHVPQWHEMRKTVVPDRRADDDALPLEERRHLRVGHLDLLTTTHGRDCSQPRPRRSFAMCLRYYLSLKTYTVSQPRIFLRSFLLRRTLSRPGPQFAVAAGPAVAMLMKSIPEPPSARSLLELLLHEDLEQIELIGREL